MNYGFWIHGALDRGRLASALAEAASLPPNAVDVADERVADRDWGAPVLCSLAALPGDFSWHLEIYFAEAVLNPPSEEVIANRLADELSVVVAYQTGTGRPSSFWIVDSDGNRIRARVYEEDPIDEDGSAPYRVDAVERPIAGWPGLPVAAIPEVIRDYRVASPTTDRLRQHLESSLDDDTTGMRTVSMWLGTWEGMVTRLTEGWPPDGWYPAAYYREDLVIRDKLTDAVDSLPDSVKAEVVSALDEVDQRYRSATTDDGGQSLAAAAGPIPSDHWWWRRVPRPLPWQDEPARPAPAHPAIVTKERFSRPVT